MANRTKVDFINVGEMTDSLFGESQKAAQSERDTAQIALTEGRVQITELIASGNFDEGMILHQELTTNVAVATGKYKAAMAGVDMKALGADFVGTSIALHVENSRKYEPEPYSILEEAILALKGYTFVPEKQESGEILFQFTTPPVRQRSGNSPARSGEQSLTDTIMGSNTGKPVTKVTVFGPTDAMCDAVGVLHDTVRPVSHSHVLVSSRRVCGRSETSWNLWLPCPRVCSRPKSLPVGTAVCTSFLVSTSGSQSKTR